MSLEDIKDKAFELGASGVGYSDNKGKRFWVEYDDKKIHFGSKNGQTYIDHKDNKKRLAWQARHSKIKNKAGEFVYKLQKSPDFWAWNLLW